MARIESTKGACGYCGRTVTRTGMARHLPACAKRREAVTAAGQKTGGNRTWIHLQVQDGWNGSYWLHLEMDAAATLEQLDRYLRAIWLECCGHLSQFSAGGWRGRVFPMRAKAGQVFRPGAELTHIYDFGTESVTRIKAIAERQGAALSKHPIVLLARNDPLEMRCMECRETAEWLCIECIYAHEAEGTLCQAHAETHPHHDYGEPLPIVNSPRVGLCGYTGPADPPY
jgi:hypothetical protein